MRWGLVAVGSVGSALAAAALLTPRVGDPGGGATPSATRCGSSVVRDWADDGRVQGRYSAACYRAAIDKLPEDLRAYSSASDDLQRALQSALHRDG
jgi:hypothetical protein